MRAMATGHGMIPPVQPWGLVKRANGPPGPRGLPFSPLDRGDRASPTPSKALIFPLITGGRVSTPPQGTVVYLPAPGNDGRGRPATF